MARIVPLVSPARKPARRSPSLETLEARDVPTTAPAYVVPLSPNVTIQPLLTVGESVNLKPDGVTPYRAVGIMDGLGAYDNGDGTFTVVMNHEIPVGISNGVATPLGGVRAHGNAGAFVSKWTITKDTLQVLHIEDLIQSATSIFLSNNDPGTGTVHTAYLPGGTTAMGRLCSADLAEPGAYGWTDPATGVFYGTTARIFQTGEEQGGIATSITGGGDLGETPTHYGRQWNMILTDDPSIPGDQAGTAYEMPHCGLFSWENNLASPFAQRKTITVGMDDSTGGQLYFWVGDKQTTGNVVERAGLTRQSDRDNLFVLRVDNLTPDATGATNEARGTPVSGTFSLMNEGDVTGLTFGELEALSDTKGGTQFLRPEDGHWNLNNPNDYYFVTTDRYDQVKDGVGTQVGRSRLYRLRFADITNPERGGTIECLLDGTEGGNMFDNMTVDRNGRVLIQEDVGGVAHSSKIWQYDIATDSLIKIAGHNPALFGDLGIPATAPYTQDEESSGIIDVSDILGPGAFLLDVQAHYNPGDAELVEGGQLLVMRITGTTVGLDGGALVAHGTPGRDVVAVSVQPNNRIGVTGLDVATTYPLAGVTSITIAGSAGDDILTIDARLAINALISGGVGNDLLVSGGGNDVVLGGDGRDFITNLGGADVLIGGRGSDSIADFGTNSILIGGTTAYDADVPALAQIRATWTNSTLTYEQKVANLRTGTGVPRLDLTTVFDDGAFDLLLGLGGQDYFWAFGLDRTDRSDGELVN